jgi:hypothetical protein
MAGCDSLCLHCFGGFASTGSRGEAPPSPFPLMRARQVFFTGLAEEDLDQIEDYIAAHDPAAAARSFFRVQARVIARLICFLLSIFIAS